MIPYKVTAKNRPAFFPKVALPRPAPASSRLVGKLKRFKRIALRCEKTARNYGSFVALASASSSSNPSTRPRRRSKGGTLGIR